MLGTAIRCIFFTCCNLVAYGDLSSQYQLEKAPDGHRLVYGQLKKCVYNYQLYNPAILIHSRCGVCPTYFQKMCGFDFTSNSTYIFDNHCVMDLYNCLHGTSFRTVVYEECLYFGNFAYVHGKKATAVDYDDYHDHKKNPDFV